MWKRHETVKDSNRYLEAGKGQGYSLTMLLKNTTIKILALFYKRSELIHPAKIPKPKTWAVKFSGRYKAEFFQWKTVGSSQLHVLFSPHNIFTYLKNLLPKCKSWTFLHFHRLRRHICFILSPKFQTFPREAGLSMPPRETPRAKLQVCPLDRSMDLSWPKALPLPIALYRNILSFLFPMTTS